MTSTSTAENAMIVVSSRPPTGQLLEGEDAAVARLAAAVFGEMASTFRHGRPEVGRVLARKARACLRHLSGCLTARLVAAVAATDSARVATQEDSSMPGEVAVYDEYFGLGRALVLSPSEQVLSALPTMAAVATCLGHPRVPLQLDESAYLSEFMSDLLSSSSTDVPPLTGFAWAGQDESPLIPPLPRWKVGHRIYGLANRAAAHALDAAASEVMEGRPDGAAQQVRQASRRIRAITAAMELAASMSSLEYVRSVRLTMAPPETQFELTGAMNLDHAAYRTALGRFLASSGQPFAALRRESKALADARSAVLHADLYDLEHHIALTYRLVGDVPALDENDSASAVQSLRGMYQDRTSRYHPFFRTAPAHAAPTR